METKCIQLLDDGIPRSDPMGMIGQYNFGSSPELLFCPVDRREEMLSSRRNNNNSSSSGSSSRGVGGDGQQQQQHWKTSFMVEAEGNEQQQQQKKKYAYDPIIRFRPQIETEAEAAIDSMTAVSAGSSYSSTVVVTESSTATERSSTVTDDVLLQV